MSDKMYPKPFEQLLDWVLREIKSEGTVFGVPPAAQMGGTTVTYQGKKLALPFGPAAGPHTQLAQNIVCAYAAGARYFELKTVQIIDGDSLHVDKPCIFARQEGYNVEWSSELTVQAAFEEYAKAWFLLHIVSRELNSGDGGGFIFNMSVGYDLEGIRSPKIDGFLNMMKDASNTPIWKHMKEMSLDSLDMFNCVTQKDINDIPAMISDSVTLSTLHGCPAAEIEAIAAHLMRNKGLHTSVKCNPMLLGFDFVKQALSNAGYDYLEPDEKVFETDLTFSEAVSMIKRLKETADGCGSDFGIKLTNTLPVKSYDGLLPGDSYYISGSALYPLTMTVTARLGKVLGEQIHMSYSGGADESNIDDIIKAGIWPVTVSTRLLKPGGYKNITKMATLMMDIKPGPLDQVQLQQLADKALRKPDRQPVKLGHPVTKTVLTGDRLCRFCSNCIDVCPNRANLGFEVNGQKIALHYDAFCNECGNCADFCPKGFIPYKDKLTLFDSPAHLQDSANEGLAVLGQDKNKYLVRYNEAIVEKTGGSITGEEQVDAILEAVLSGRAYLVKPNVNAAERTDV